MSNARGRGLMIAFDLPDDGAAQQGPRGDHRRAGLLLLTLRPRSIRFRPPLNLTAAEADTGPRHRAQEPQGAVKRRSSGGKEVPDDRARSGDQDLQRDAGSQGARRARLVRVAPEGFYEVTLESGGKNYTMPPAHPVDGAPGRGGRGGGREPSEVRALKPHAQGRPRAASGPSARAIARLVLATRGPAGGGGDRSRPSTRRARTSATCWACRKSPHQGGRRPRAVHQEGQGRRRRPVHLVVAQGHEAAGARRSSQRGMHVVTTCEELAFPIPETARPSRARSTRRPATKKVSVLATGVNPGFAMDALALMLTAPCAEVTPRLRDAGGGCGVRAACRCSARWERGST